MLGKKERIASQCGLAERNIFWVYPLACVCVCVCDDFVLILCFTLIWLPTIASSGNQLQRPMLTSSKLFNFITIIIEDNFTINFAYCNVRVWWLKALEGKCMCNRFVRSLVNYTTCLHPPPPSSRLVAHFTTKTNQRTHHDITRSCANWLDLAKHWQSQAAENVAATLRFDVIWMSISYISTTWKSPRLAQILTSIIVHHVDVKWHGILHVSKTTNIFKIKNADALLLSLRYLLFLDLELSDLFYLYSNF